MGPRLAPDNSTVVYVIWPKVGESVTPRRLMRVQLSGGPPETVLQHVGIGNLQCARLPSTLCLYDSRSATQLSFFRFDPATGKSEELTQVRIEDQPPYAYNWSLSPDGKILATAKREGVQKDPSITFFSLEDGSKHTVTAQAWAGIGGMKRSDLKDLGELLDDGASGLVVVTASDVEAKVEAAITRAKKRAKAQLQADTAALKKDIDNMRAA